MTRAAFLDRDGVINAAITTAQGPDSPRSADEFELLPGVIDAIRALNVLGMPVVVISNQPGVAKGKFGLQALNEITSRMTSILQENGAFIDGVYYCLHHPDAVVDQYRVSCDCRKPQPGLLLKAARDLGLMLEGSYMVGDQWQDMVAGKAVGCTTILVASRLITDRPAEADHLHDDLATAVSLIADLEKAIALSPARR